uniref:Zmp:0000001048 n=1 Tax=Salmo trutta TaxID=8032 RepID=A0A673ZDN8_SALTR
MAFTAFLYTMIDNMLSSIMREQGVTWCYLSPSVSNAGVGMIGPLECHSVSDGQGLFDTNFFGLVLLVKEVLPDMKRRRSGHIVVMSSIMGIQGELLFNDVYSASKFAVEGFCESLAVQWSFISPCFVHLSLSLLLEPGPVGTEFERKVYDDAEKMDLAGADEETARIFREIYLPYSRKVFNSLAQTPEEIAEVTLCYVTILYFVTTILVLFGMQSQHVILWWLNGKQNILIAHLYSLAANTSTDHSEGASLSPPNQPGVHAHDCPEARRPYRSSTPGHLL